jgi:alkylation response protein AidB-like acyl-CoA dehydrogenase
MIGEPMAVIRELCATIRTEPPRDVRAAATALAPLVRAPPLDAQTSWQALRQLGAADLSVGRLFEGHLNAWRLVAQFGSPPLREHAATLMRGGSLLALWVADDPHDGVVLDGERLVLRGAKRFCSGAHAVGGAVITARIGEDAQLVWIDGPSRARFDAGDAWPLTGMHATESVRCDMTGLEIAPQALLGPPGAYLREPAFSSGLWRILALQLGALDGLAACFAAHLLARGHAAAPAQRQRLALNAMDIETAALWSAHAAEAADSSPEAVLYVALARTVIQDVANRVMGRVRSGMGLCAAIAGTEPERRLRDLTTFLCQPAPDAAFAAATERLSELDWRLPSVMPA